MAADGNKINRIKDEPSDSRTTGCGQTELTTSKGKEERMSRLPLLRDQHAHQAATTPRKNGRLIAAVWCSAPPPPPPPPPRSGQQRHPALFVKLKRRETRGKKGAEWQGRGGVVVEKRPRP